MQQCWVGFKHTAKAYEHSADYDYNHHDRFWLHGQPEAQEAARNRATYQHVVDTKTGETSRFWGIDILTYVPPTHLKFLHCV